MYIYIYMYVSVCVYIYILCYVRLCYILLYIHIYVYAITKSSSDMVHFPGNPARKEVQGRIFLENISCCFQICGMRYFP